VLGPSSSLAVRVTDLDPKRESLLDPVTYVEQPVGIGVATARELATSSSTMRIDLKNGGSVVGWVRVRVLVASDDSPPQGAVE
jgi:hypothetical protein